MADVVRGLTALVTGASSGIGAEMARQLAARGANVIVTARRGDRLEALAKDLRAAHEVNVDVVVLDLGKADAAAALFDKTEGAGKPVDVLINNAGFGTQEHFVDAPWEKLHEQMQLNIVSLTELSSSLLEGHARRKRGWILNVASIGAYLPCPDYATYAAGKAYVRDFTEALAHELRRSPLRVCCLCPGGTATEFFEVAGQKPNAVVKMSLMSPARCARIGLRALLGGRRNIVAGVMNTLGMFLLRFIRAA